MKICDSEISVVVFDWKKVLQIKIGNTVGALFRIAHSFVAVINWFALRLGIIALILF